MTILLLSLFFALLPFAHVFAVWFDGKTIHLAYISLYQVPAVKYTVPYRTYIRLPFAIFLPKVSTLTR